jgi:hypothetical protein
VQADLHEGKDISSWDGAGASWHGKCTPASQRFTYFRDTLETVNTSKHKNVTLSLPEPLLRRFRIYAATRNQSMTRLMAESIRRMIDQDVDADRAARRFMERIENAPDRGTGGVIRWTRDELHER